MEHWYSNSYKVRHFTVTYLKYKSNTNDNFVYGLCWLFLSQSLTTCAGGALDEIFSVIVSLYITINYIIK